jgi:urea transport system permease protein
MSPSLVGIVPSIEMVIYAAVGGRMSLIGAVYGTLAVNYGKTYFSETLPELWLFLMGGLFIGVVLYFPNGIAGLWVSHGKDWLNKLFGKNEPATPAAPISFGQGVSLPGATTQANQMSITGLEASK